MCYKISKYLISARIGAVYCKFIRKFSYFERENCFFILVLR